MSDLLIRNIAPKIKRQIQERARVHRRSISDEAKFLIRKGLSVPDPDFNMGTFLAGLVRPEDRGDDLVFKYSGTLPKPPDFE